MPQDSSSLILNESSQPIQGAQSVSAMQVLQQSLVQIKDNGLLDYQDLQDVANFLAKAIKAGRDEFAYSVVVADLLNDYSFVKVEMYANAANMAVWYRGPKDEVYRPLPMHKLREILTIYYKRNRLGYLASRIENAAKTLINDTTASVKTISDRVIRVSKEWYYDTLTGGLYEGMDYISEGEGPNKKPVCFRSLFDSTGAKIFVDINDVHFERSEVSAIEAYLNDHKEISPPDQFLEEMAPYEDTYDCAVAAKAYASLKFFWVAADYNIGRYNDLIKTFMMEFQYEKPGFFFFFIGEKINGKSSMQMCRHVLFGSQNVTTLSMQQLTSWDHSYDVARAMTNAPLEDCDPKMDNIDADLGMLKCIATHEQIELRIKNESAGISYTPNFLSFFPRNKIPDFGNSDGLQALVGRRTKIIHFTHDFSAESNNGKNFNRDTFTASFYSGMLPLVLGMARFYRGKEIPLSDESEKFAKDMEAIMDPVSYFLSRVYRWFDYVGSPKFILAQAKMYLIDNGVTDAYEKSQSILTKIARLEESRPTYDARRRGKGELYYHDYQVKKARCRKCPKVKGVDKRLKAFTPDIKLAALGGMSPEEYYSKLDADSVDGQYAQSIITILDEMEKDAEENRSMPPGHLVAVQNSMLDLDERMRKGEFDR